VGGVSSGSGKWHRRAGFDAEGYQPKHRAFQETIGRRSQFVCWGPANTQPGKTRGGRHPMDLNSGKQAIVELMTRPGDIPTDFPQRLYSRGRMAKFSGKARDGYQRSIPAGELANIGKSGFPSAFKWNTLPLKAAQRSMGDGFSSGFPLERDGRKGKAPKKDRRIYRVRKTSNNATSSILGPKTGKTRPKTGWHVLHRDESTIGFSARRRQK